MCSFFPLFSKFSLFFLWKWSKFLPCPAFACSLAYTSNFRDALVIILFHFVDAWSSCWFCLHPAKVDLLIVICACSYPRYACLSCDKIVYQCVVIILFFLRLKPLFMFTFILNNMCLLYLFFSWIVWSYSWQKWINFPFKKLNHRWSGKVLMSKFLSIFVLIPNTWFLVVLFNHFI